MSKSGCELVTFECLNKDKTEHSDFSKETPSFLITGEVTLLPRKYKTDSNCQPRKFGLQIPVNCCSQCWDKLDIPGEIRKLAASDEYKDLLKLDKEYIEDKSLPVANREVFCNNASHSMWHETPESVGNTHDIIGRALFTIQPLAYLSFIDYNVYQGSGKSMNAYTFELEMDFCFHCLERSWEAAKVSRLDKLVARFQDEKSPDPRNDPNFAATFNYFQGLAGGK